MTKRKATWRDKRAQLRAERTPEQNAAYEVRRQLATIVVGARALRGINQSALAKLIGSSQAKVSDYERGEGNPTWDTLARLFGALGLTMTVTLSEIDAVSVPRAEYEALLRDREDLHKLQVGIQQALVSQAASTEPAVAVVKFPEIERDPVA